MEAEDGSVAADFLLCASPMPCVRVFVFTKLLLIFF
jgi:hypothetical protein